MRDDSSPETIDGVIVWDAMRRVAQDLVNRSAAEREALQVRYGAVWDAAEMAQEFEILQFASPFVLAGAAIRCKGRPCSSTRPGSISISCRSPEPDDSCGSELSRT